MWKEHNRHPYKIAKMILPAFPLVCKMSALHQPPWPIVFEDIHNFRKFTVSLKKSSTAMDKLTLPPGYRRIFRTVLLNWFVLPPLPIHTYSKNFAFLNDQMTWF